MGRAEREQGAACWPPCLPRSQYAPSCPLSYPPPPPPRRHLSPACCSRPTPTTPTACGETRQHQRKEGGEARAPLFLCFCSRYAPACSLLLLPTTQLFAHRPPPSHHTHPTNDGGGGSGKVADFGLSRALLAGATHASTRHWGTVACQPPELLASGALRREGDVYAFGVLLWQLAHRGERPFGDMMPGEVKGQWWRRWCWPGGGVAAVVCRCFPGCVIHTYVRPLSAPDRACF